MSYPSGRKFRTGAEVMLGSEERNLLVGISFRIKVPGTQITKSSKGKPSEASSLGLATGFSLQRTTSEILRMAKGEPCG